MIFKKIFKKIIDYKKSSVWRNTVTLFPPEKLFPKKEYKGFVLLSYLTAPFYFKENDSIFKTHSNHWECIQIAKTFLDLGYVVDVIIFKNKDFIPKKKYKVFIDLGYNLERITPFLNEDCIKILHITEAHWLFNNIAEYNRLAELKKRRNLVLQPRKVSDSNFGIEYADIGTVLGNKFTSDTYMYQQKMIYRIPISSPVVYDFPVDKDFEKVKKNYLWFGSVGLVHRGLDLVLEAFCNLPEYNLFVCGPIDDEDDFVRAYYKELYETQNIKTVGWVDVNSDKFIDILNNCISIIYPSCSEGGGGSVITCMHGGLIPIVSYEASVDVDDFGYILKENTVDEITGKIKLLSNLDIDEIKNRRIKTWEFARANHTKEKFASEYKKFVKEIIKL